MELPDNLLAELEILENITSCNKVKTTVQKFSFKQILLFFSHHNTHSRWQQHSLVLSDQNTLIYQLSTLDQVENYLMLSEYEQNLSKVRIYLGIRGFKPFLTKDFKINLYFDFSSFDALFYSEWQWKQWSIQLSKSLPKLQLSKLPDFLKSGDWEPLHGAAREEVIYISSDES